MGKKSFPKTTLKPRWWIIAGGSIALLLVVAIWLFTSLTPVSAEAPEAPAIFKIQAGLPFQVMIPAYLPSSFNRAGVETQVSQSGPGGEPMVQLTYKTPSGASLFVREWVPTNPALETLANSRIIQTKWGKGWLLTQSDTLIAMWVDVGPTRVSVYTSFLDEISRNQLLQIAETLGPPSANQVFYFDLSANTIKDAAPPEPYVVPLNSDGVQEFTLVITPGGYDPIRFSVQANKPVRMHFRMLGQVGCGDTLIFPTGAGNIASLKLKSAQDEQVLDFTPVQTGDIYFTCGHQMYEGVMTVRP